MPETRSRGTALVTGASAGIGAELAEVFAERGFDLIVVARRREKLEALAERCRERHGSAVTVLAQDLLEPGAPRALRDGLEAGGHEVDVLVNDAGVLETGAFEELELERHLRLIRLNVEALTTLTHLFLEPMRRRRSGRILNIASIAAFQPVPTLAVYAASKAFVLSLTEALSEELKGSGVSVTALCPGLTRTRMLDQVERSNLAARLLPGALLSDPRRVAQEGYEACMAGEVIRVPGIPNRIATRLVQLYPRWMVRSVSGWIGRWGLGA